MADNAQEDFAMGDFADDELDGLFSAFDGMGASDALKAKTLGTIAALPTAAAASTVSTAASQAPAPAAPVESAPRPTAQAGGKAARKAMRSPFRFARAAAVAACVSAALVGGVAYAMPTSHVLLVQGDASIELGVNRFGMVVSAESDDDAGRAIIDSNGLLHVSYEDALALAAVAMDSSLPDGQLALSVTSNDAVQRERLESGNASFLVSRESKAPTPQMSLVESDSSDRTGSSVQSDGDAVTVDSAADPQPAVSQPGAGYQYVHVSQPSASVAWDSSSRGSSGRTSSEGRVDSGSKVGDKARSDDGSDGKTGAAFGDKRDDESSEKSDGKQDGKQDSKSDGKSGRESSGKDDKPGGNSAGESDEKAAPTDPQPDDVPLYWLKTEDPEQPDADDDPSDSGFEDWADDELLADDGSERPELVDTTDQEPAKGQEPAIEEPAQDRESGQDQKPVEHDDSTGWWIPPVDADSDAWWKPIPTPESTSECESDS